MYLEHVWIRGLTVEKGVEGQGMMLRSVYEYICERSPKNTTLLTWTDRSQN